MSESKDFDQFLAQNLRKTQSYIADDGFSAKVAHRLGKQRRRERWFVGLPALAITLLVVWQLPLTNLPRQVWYWVAGIDVASLIAASAVGTFIALLACAFWLAREMKLI